ncbi:MAG: HEAT repeat domain-containing protein [Pseudomonadota bacterium]
MKKLAMYSAILVFFSASWMAPAQAKGGTKKQPKKVKMSAEVKEAVDLLKNDSDDTKVEGISKLAELADPTGVTPLIDLLEKGQTDKVTHAAIDALGAISSPKAIPILTEYMKHRRSKVRILAINAIAEIKDKQVIEALKNALKDSDSMVRKTAALALGRYGDQSAVDVLFKAFDRNVVEAAIAIGQIGNVNDMERLSSYLGSSPLVDLLPGFSEFLTRESFPEKGKLTILEKLMELAGPEVKQFLIKFVENLPADYQGPVKKKAQDAISSIAD